MKAKLRDRLELALLDVGGDTIKFGVRRYRVKETVAARDLTVVEPSAA